MIDYKMRIRSKKLCLDGIFIYKKYICLVLDKLVFCFGYVCVCVLSGVIFFECSKS